MVLTLLLQIAAAGAPGFGFALECGRCGSLDQGAQWRFAELPLVVSVAEGSAASRGGMQAGDTLIAVDGLSLLSEAGSRRFAGARAGDRVSFLVGREGKRVEVAIVPATVSSNRTGGCLETSGPRSSTKSSIESKTSDNAKWIIEWNRGTCSVLLNAQGAFKLRPDLSDVESLGSGSTFSVNVREEKQRRELAVKSDRGTLVHEWKVDGKTTPWTDESRRWLGGLLTDLDRRTAFAIDARFPELMRRGGASIVLGEIAQMTGEIARGQYYVRLADSATLTASDIRTVLSQMERNPVNTFSRGRVLAALQKQSANSDPSLVNDYIRAAAALSPLARGRALESIAQRGSLSSESLALLIESLTSRGNGFENARVFENLIRNGVIKAPDLEMAIRATRQIDPDMSRARVLELFASHYRLEGTARQAYIDAAKSIRVEMLRNRLLATLVAKEQ